MKQRKHQELSIINIYNKIIICVILILTTCQNGADKKLVNNQWTGRSLAYTCLENNVKMFITDLLRASIPPDTTAIHISGK